MSKPIVAYLSMLREAGVTLSDPGTAAGYDRADMSNLKSYQGWVSSVVTAPQQFDVDGGVSGKNADYIALVNHNLHTLGATIKVMYGTSFPAATVALAATAPAEDTVTYLPFTAPGAKRYWRIEIDHASPPFTAAPRIGELLIGMKTLMPEYCAPGFDPFFRGTEVAGSRSEGGHYLAGTIRGRTHRGTMTFGDAGAARSAFTSDLNAFIDNHADLKKPFVFILDLDDTDFKTPSWVKEPDDRNVVRGAVLNHWGRLTFELPMEEAMKELVS